MAWIDGLDIPFSYYTESHFFFNFGREGSGASSDRSTPQHSRSERLWGYPGCARCPARCAKRHAVARVSLGGTIARCAEQLALEGEGHAVTFQSGAPACDSPIPPQARRAADDPRGNPHRIRLAGVGSRARREVGSSVYQVFDGVGTVTVGGSGRGPSARDFRPFYSWTRFTAAADAGGTDLDLFRFSDSPIFEALHRASRPCRGSSRGYGMSMITLARLGLAAWLAFACGLSSAQHVRRSPCASSRRSPAARTGCRIARRRREAHEAVGTAGRRREPSGRDAHRDRGGEEGAA